MLLPRSKIKFFSLWRKVKEGSLNVDDAVALLPKRDMRIVEIKARQAERARIAAETPKAPQRGSGDAGASMLGEEGTEQ